MFEKNLTRDPVKFGIEIGSRVMYLCRVTFGHNSQDIAEV